jgi:DNA-binding HxlR family transcriptional regulator
MKNYQKISSECSLGKVMCILGNKWKPIIIVTINDRTLRFGEVAKSINLISRKVLTDQLKEMKNDGLLIREEFKELPPRVEYSLTKRGLALLPIFHLFEKWEEEYLIEEIVQ